MGTHSPTPGEQLADRTVPIPDYAVLVRHWDKLNADYAALAAKHANILARLDLANRLIEDAYREGYSTACGVTGRGTITDHGTPNLDWRSSRAHARLKGVSP